MDLIEDHQLALMFGKVELRLCELGSVRIGLEIEIDRRPCLGYFERECSLADLARPNQCHGRDSVYQFGELRFDAALDHPRNYGVQFLICKDGQDEIDQH